MAKALVCATDTNSKSDTASTFIVSRWFSNLTERDEIDR